MITTDSRIAFSIIRSRMRKVARMSVLCYKNSIRLHNDSIYLYKQRSYPSAIALSIIAIEEMGKYQWLSHALFYNNIKSNDDEIMAEILHETYDHRKKQRIFVNHSWHDNLYSDMKRINKKGLNFGILYKRFIGERENINLNDPDIKKYFPNMRKHYLLLSTLENLKQNSLYVGFPKKRGLGADLSKKINSPFRFGRKIAENHITILNDYLLIEALQVMKGMSSFENWEQDLTDMITTKYITRLRQKWPRNNKNNRKKLLELIKYPDDKY